MCIKALFLLACSLLVSATLLAATEVVTLKDGREFTGEVTVTKDGNLVVKMKRGESPPIKPEDIKSRVLMVTPEEEYAQKLKEIDLKSADDHYKLGKWASEKKIFEIAEKELNAALEINPKHERALLALRLVKDKRAEAGKAGKINGKLIPKKNGNSGKTSSPAVKAKWLISKEDIYRVRFAELRESDRVSVMMKNDVVDRFIEAMQGTGDFEEKNFAKRFRGWSKLKKAKYIHENTDSDNTSIRHDILITKDPRFMAEFRTQIWPMLTTSCASLACHGGEKGKGGLKVFNISAKNVKVDYTNYVLLWGGVRKNDGGGHRRMIDKNWPNLSLVLQYGLPAANARYKHPVKIKSLFKSTKDKKYVRVINWIKSLEGPPMPDYHLTYKPPFGMKVQGDIIDLGIEEPATKPENESEKKPKEKTED